MALLPVLSVCCLGGGYMLKRFVDKRKLVQAIKNNLLQVGSYNGYILKRGYIGCSVPVTQTMFEFDDKIIYKKLQVEIGNKQINNTVEEVTDIIPTYGLKHGFSFSLASRPVNKVNYYTEWKKYKTTDTIGTDITLDDQILNISSLGNAVCNHSRTKTFALSSDILYKHPDKLNHEGNMLKSIIDTYQIPYDTELVRVTESVLSPFYVLVIGKRNYETMSLNVSHIFTDTGDTLDRIISEDIIGKN